jgi:hypothetical protein
VDRQTRQQLDGYLEGRRVIDITCLVHVSTRGWAILARLRGLASPFGTDSPSKFKLSCNRFRAQWKWKGKLMKTSKPIRNARLLLGFLVKGEVDAIFKQNPFEILQSNADAIQLWRRSQEAVAGLPLTPPVASVQVLDNGKSGVVEEIKARPTYRKHYESFADFRFAMVPINALLTPQWIADMDYIAELSHRISPDAGIEEQIRFAMTDGVITEPIIVGNQVIFASQGRDLHAEQIPSVRRVATGEFEIFVRASSRPNYIQAVEIGNRLLLTNGVHKVCALLLKGYTHVPCVLRRVSRVEETGLNLQSSLFRPDLFGGPRPAQVTDFLNEDVAIAISMRSAQQVLTVTLSVGVLQVPTVTPPPSVAEPGGDLSAAITLVPPELGGSVGAGTDDSSRRPS